jgi:hypothetical protein
MKQCIVLLFPLFTACSSSTKHANQPLVKAFPYTDTFRFMLQSVGAANVPAEYYVRHISADSSVPEGFKDMNIDGKAWRIVAADVPRLSSY